MNKNGQNIEAGADVITDEAQLIKEIQVDYEYAFKKAKPFLDIMVKLAAEHNNALDPSKMPTRSKMSIPYKYAQTEEALGKAAEYLWPPQNPLRGIPEDDGVTIEQVRKIESAAYHMVKDRMCAEIESLPIMRDSCKQILGYGILEPTEYEPLEMVNLSVEKDGKPVSSSREVQVGQKVKSLRIRYLTGGQVIPYPDGRSPNGHSRASTVFVWDFETQRNFKNIVSQQQLEGLDFDVAKLTDQVIEEIIQKAKGGNISFVGQTFDYIKKLGGIDYKSLINAEKSAQATIPILKVYREGEHIWLANGDTIIYRQAAKVQTYRCPVLRMCSVVDGMSWYPFTTSEAMYDINYGRNVWLNMINDLMTWSTKRPLVWSTSAFDEKPDFGPDGNIPTSAPDARTAAAFLQPPGIDAGTMQGGQILDQIAAEISGVKDFTQKNFSRGGQNAFNDLLNSARGRERIAGAVMESGFMNDLFNQVLIYMQIQGIGFSGTVRGFDEKTGTETMSRLDVTGDDMKHAMKLIVSLDRKKFATEFSVQDRISIYGVLKDDATIREYEKKRFLFGNDDLLHQMAKSADEMDQIQTENRSDQRMAAQSASAPTGGAAPPMMPGPAGAELGGAPDMTGAPQ